MLATKCVSKTHGYDSTLKGVETSLQKMGFGSFFIILHATSPLNARAIRNTDYIDLFLIHDPFSGKERRLVTYKALLEKQVEGKIRSVGVSN